MTDHADAGAPLLIGTQGWKQFLTSKKEMLDAFDGAKEKARAHLVQTSHGNVAEEEFRKWLSGFLPKKYAVTAGYIVSQGVGDEILLPHFEVVIYDQLESPVLWVESDSGLPLEKRPRAVPAEHVRAVLEVKSSLEASSALDALRHLDHLAPLLAGADPPNERYKKYLPPNFLSGVVFFELRKKHEFSRAALNNLVPRKVIRGYFGGIVLRGEGLVPDKSGKIWMLKSKTPLRSTVGKQKGKGSLLHGAPIADSKQFAQDQHLVAMVMWSEVCFAQFAFDVLALLNGTYTNGYVSSFHGLSWMNPARQSQD